jgi:hypothetical protein
MILINFNEILLSVHVNLFILVKLPLMNINPVNQHPAVHHEGSMISGQETVFCWVSVPKLTMVVSSVAFFKKISTYLLITHKQVGTK